MPFSDQEQDPDRNTDPLVEHEANAAAAQARHIGGARKPASDDPAMEPVYEAGGGEQEAWEQAEDALVEAASHGDSPGDPSQAAFRAEREADRATAVDGEADEVRSTELADDTDRHR